MKRRELLAIGARLANGGSTLGRLRFAAAVLAMAAVATAVLVLGAIPGAIQARSDRADARTPQADPAGSSERSVAVASRRTAIDGRSATVVLVGTEGSTPAGGPVGVRKLPAPGSSAVSPELARLLASPSGKTIRAQFGDVVETIAPEGLVDRHELFGYVGVALDQLEAHDRADPGGVGHRTFRAHPSSARPNMWPWLLGLVALLLGPLVALVMAAARLSEANDRRQLAALRLLGCSDRQLGTVRAGALLPATVIGAAIGLAAFLTGVHVLDGHVIAGRTIEAADVHITSTALVGAIIVGAVMWLSGRRLVHQAVEDPWGARRGAVTQAPRAWGLVALLLGSLVLVAVVTLGDTKLITDDLLVDTGLIPVHVAGVTLVVIGLIAGAPFLVTHVGHALAQRARSLWLQLGSRSASADSGSPARWGAMVGAVLLLGTFGIGYAQIIAGSYRLNDASPPGGMVITQVSSPELVASLEAVAPGRVAPIWDLADSSGDGALIARCGDLAAVDPRVVGCRAGVRSYDLDYFESESPTIEIGGERVHVPAPTGRLRNTGGDHQAYGGVIESVLLDDTRALAAARSEPPTVILVRPRSAAQRAGIERAISAIDPIAATDDAASTRDWLRRTRPIDERAAGLFTQVVAGLMVVGLIVALIDRTLDAVDAHRPLVALGASVWTRSSAHALSSLLALVVALTCSLGLGVLADLSWRRVIHHPLGASWTGVRLAALASALSLVLVGTASWIAARAAGRRDWERE